MSSTSNELNSDATETVQDKSALPSRNGDASHTLLGNQLAGMTDLLIQKAPGCTSTALNLLRDHFPETPLRLRIKACAIFAERLYTDR